MQDSSETVNGGSSDRGEVAGGEEKGGNWGYDEDRVHLDRNHVLICCTGSVDTMLLPMLLEELSELKYNIEAQVVVTNHARNFFDRSCLPVRVYCDVDEWELWNGRSDPVLHIELCRWADILLITPLDANTLAKIANGICDNLLTCVVRAWDLKKPVLFAPSMSKMMWHHPITASQISTLKSFGFEEIPVTEKAATCAQRDMLKISSIIRRLIKNLERINGLTRLDSAVDKWTLDALSL